MIKSSVRIASVADLEDIVCLERGFSIVERYSEELLNASFQQVNTTNFVIEVDGKVVGYLMSTCVLDEAELLKIIIKKEYRGLGLASILMRYYIDTMLRSGVKKIFLEVRKDNVSAKALYLKFDFKKVHERLKYYDDGVDAEIYWYNANVEDEL